MEGFDDLALGESCLLHLLSLNVKPFCLLLNCLDFRGTYNRTSVTKTCSDKCASAAYKARVRAAKIEKSNLETAQLKARKTEELRAKEFLSINEVTELLPLSRRTIYRLIEEGELNAAKFGARALIRRVDIDALFIKPKHPEA
ncbi:helix-turn-helix domain-containing protein [Rufibacter sp. XAAS-G3-1]|uniref:helix-turn-helix domain-containing protein n=1 Tax=Rufibacter sp. XAAS-G3-1 TaxID=2729134 RepID=UPI0015E7505D|nr:helix-turn-helix domain-containing protein [Rufibacter sp. XAAS-G3-1]